MDNGIVCWHNFAYSMAKLCHRIGKVVPIKWHTIMYCPSHNPRSKHRIQWQRSLRILWVRLLCSAARRETMPVRRCGFDNRCGGWSCWWYGCWRSASAGWWGFLGFRGSLWHISPACWNGNRDIRRQVRLNGWDWWFHRIRVLPVKVFRPVAWDRLRL